MAAIRCLNWQVDALTKIHAPIQAALESELFTRYGGTNHSLETGLWGLGTHSDGMSPLPDEVEIGMVRYLTRNPGAIQEQIESAINLEFPGLYTPQISLVNNVLASYATQSDSGWILRSEDSPTTRRIDLKNMAGLLETLGKRFGYDVSTSENQDQPIIWLKDGLVVYTYHIIASAVIGRLMMQESPPKGVSCIVLPGGRAGLLSYKLERDPALNLLAARWQILKFRQIRSLAADKTLTLQDWLNKMGSDPITQPEQMRLL
jgi:hypothetical protein